MNSRTFRITVTVCVAVLAVGAWLADAGPLDPPPGPIGPTGRFGPRTEVSAATTPGDADSVFRISEPGSYYLAGNVTGEVGKSGIEIDADDVTLDLNGFALIGVPGSLHGVTVVSAVPARANIAVSNGTSRNWGGRGVCAANASNSRLENLRASGNGTCGLYVGVGSSVFGCSASGNGEQGIGACQGSALTNCASVSNVMCGFLTGDDCTLIGCTAESNTGYGFATGSGCTLESCVAALNGQDGFDGNCSAYLNCSARGNTRNGLDGGQRSTVTNCTSRANGEIGIYADNATLITGCNASNNASHGISGDGAECHILGNVCNDNGGDGIYTRSSNSRIKVDGNHVIRNTGAGIRVSGEDCLVVRNWAAFNNPDYAISAGNHYGQIMASPGVITTCNPWANFED